MIIFSIKGINCYFLNLLRHFIKLFFLNLELILQFNLRKVIIY